MPRIAGDDRLPCPRVPSSQDWRRRQQFTTVADPEQEANTSMYVGYPTTETTAKQICSRVGNATFPDFTTLLERSQGNAPEL